MAVSGYTFGQFHYNAQRGLISDLAGVGSSIKFALLANTYTPAQNRHDCWSAPAWVASTAYALGDKVVPTVPTGHMYECVTAGTSGTGEPTWPTTDGEQISDGGAVWECILGGDISFYEVTGTGYTAGGAEFTSPAVSQSAGKTVFSGNSITWPGANFTARYGILYDATPAGDADKKLMGYIDFGADKTATDADFQIVWDSAGILETTATQA